MNSKLPISCIIVNYNEGQRLAACLQSVAFCNEIILVDLGSTDHSLDIARTLNCRVFSHPKVLIGEMARAAYIQEAKYDWILCADPDEVLDELLIKDIFSFHHQYANLPETASFAFPWQFYYRGNRLNGTVWGNYQRKSRFFITVNGFCFLIRYILFT